jgi:hypothetical protein
MEKSKLLCKVRVASGGYQLKNLEIGALDLFNRSITESRIRHRPHNSDCPTSVKAAGTRRITEHRYPLG